MFISFEGIDGSGKSTQVQRLAETLRARGREVILVREPGGTPLSETIRALLLDPVGVISPRAELFLFTAARAQLVDDVIRPALDRGAVVIADRYSDSTLAYQGAGRGVCSAETLQAIQRCATSSTSPDLTFLLDLTPEDARERRDVRERGEDRMESTGLDFYHRVRDSYLDLARREPDRFRVLSAQLLPDAIEALILSHLDG